MPLIIQGIRCIRNRGFIRRIDKATWFQSSGRRFKRSKKGSQYSCLQISEHTGTMSAWSSCMSTPPVQICNQSRRRTHARGPRTATMAARCALIYWLFGRAGSVTYWRAQHRISMVEQAEPVSCQFASGAPELKCGDWIVYRNSFFAYLMTGFGL